MGTSADTKAWRKANPEKYLRQHRRAAAAQRARPKPSLVEGCEKPAGVPGTARGFCSTHYSRFMRTGDPLTRLTDLKPKASPICKVDGCEKAKWAQGYCPMHLMRVRTDGTAGEAERRWVTPSGPCRVAGCDRTVRLGIHGLCQAHYLRRLRHGDVLAGGAFQRPRGSTCDVDGCDRRHYARGMCQAHWSKSTFGQIRQRRKVAAAGEYTAEQLNGRLAYFARQCWICGGAGTEIDHVKPLSKGGSNWPSNLRPACKSCNSRKRSRWFGVAGLDHVRDLVLGKAA